MKPLNKETHTFIFTPLMNVYVNKRIVTGVHQTNN